MPNDTRPIRRTLTLHPDSRCTAATGVEVEAARPRPGSLVLRYFVTGKIVDLRMPSVTASTRTDGLWRHTCFEAFIRLGPGAGYYEFNLAPSMRWAAYRFNDYRSGMRVVDEIGVPRIDVQSSDESYEFQASLALDGLPDLPGDAVWNVGLSAVIEEADDGMSYWALAHPPGKADFHHSDCFALELAPAWRP